MTALVGGPIEIADQVGVPYRWVVAAAKSGAIPHLRLSRDYIRFTAEHLVAVKETGVPCPTIGPARSATRRGREQVYFIADESTRAVKIGKAVDVTQRLRDLQCANPFSLRLVGVRRGPPGEERRLHALHATDRLRKNGEWFAATPAVLRSAIGCLAHPDDGDIQPAIATCHRAHVH